MENLKNRFKKRFDRTEMVFCPFVGIVHVYFANTIQMCHMRTFTMGNGKALQAGHLYQAKVRLCFPNRVEFFKVI